MILAGTCVCILGCGGHALTPPLTGPAPVVQTLATFAGHAPMVVTAAARALDALRPASKSPGTIAAPPFVRALGPHMAGAGVHGVKPQFVASISQYTQLPGSVSQAVVSPADGSLFVLSTLPAGPDKYVYHYVNGSYAGIQGKASHLAMSPYGDTLWAINSAGGIFAYTIASGTWNALAGGASDITIGADNSVYVLSNTGNDGKGNYPIWHYANGIWTQLAGSGSRIAASWDPNSYFLGAIAPGGFYLLSGSGTIFFFNTGSGFMQLTGNAQAIAPVIGGFFAVGDGSIYYYEVPSQSYSREPGNAVTVTANGTTLYAISSEGRLYAARVLLKDPLLTKFSQGAQPAVAGFGIAAGSDGALWFTAKNAIGRVTPSERFNAYDLSTGDDPEDIVAGPDGALWFTESSGNRIGRITTGGAVTEFNVPTASAGPYGIALGPDGALWFTENAAGKIGRIATNGGITEYPIPTASSAPSGIATGPDGALWFVETSGNKVGRMTTGGAATEYAIPTYASSPQGIASGSDHALWFTEKAGKIGRVTTSGSITEFTTTLQDSAPSEITAGPDGALWFTDDALGEGTGGGIGRITTAGAVTEYKIAAYPVVAQPMGITTGPDGALWNPLSDNTMGRMGLQ